MPIRRPVTGKTIAAVFADLVVVVVFVAIGRSNHHHGEAVAGLVSTSWPFAAGLAVGWGTVLFTGRNGRSLRGGAIPWLATVAIGMVLRVVSGQGTAFAFVLVALGFLGVAMLGWRLLAIAVRRH